MCCGNSLICQLKSQELQDKYGDGLMLAPEGQRVRAVLYANRAACHLELQNFNEAAKDCSAAIDLDGSYLKAWHRRSKAYEGLDDMDHALKDAQKVCSSWSSWCSAQLYSFEACIRYKGLQGCHS